MFVVTTAALSARGKIEVASLGMCRWLKGIAEHEESTKAAGCLLAGCGGLFSYSQLCDTAVSVTAVSSYFRLLKGLTLWIC